MGNVLRVWRVPNEQTRVDRAATEYTQTYGVETDDVNMEFLEVQSKATGVPGEGSTYVEVCGNFHQAAVLIHRAWKRDEKNRRVWYCDAQFSTSAAANGADPELRNELGYPAANGVGNAGSHAGTPRGGSAGSTFKPGSAKDGATGHGNYDPGDRQIDPVLRPPHVSIQTMTVRQVMALADRYVWGGSEFLQANVRPCNAADEEFEQKPERDTKILVFTIKRAERNCEYEVLADRVGTINRYEFAGKPPYTWLFDDFSAEPDYRGLFGFWWVTYRLLYKRDYWPVPILNQGFKARKVAGGTPLEITEAGRNVTRPRLLADDGTELAAGEDPVYRYYWPADMRSDFSYLHLA